jgi:hypothetical protein
VDPAWNQNAIYDGYLYIYNMILLVITDDAMLNNNDEEDSALDGNILSILNT